MHYLPRLIDAELATLCAELPAISIDGAKGVGKTESARHQHPEVTFELDDIAHRDLLEADPAALAPAGPKTLIDEWQRLPAVWDLVRRAVDGGAAPGRFLLTGSASPVDAPTHSGAGRIVSLRMRPMALEERGVSTPTVSLRSMLSGTATDVGGRCALTLADYAEEIIRSGLPGIRTHAMGAVRAQLDGYLARIVEHDFPDQGRPVRRPATLTNWMRAYAAAISTTASYNSVMAAATPGEAQKPAKTTTTAYRDVLSQLWLLDPLPAWSPTSNQFGRLGAAPKHHLADPALAARLLGLTIDALRGRSTGPGAGAGPAMLGPLFESLVTLGVRSAAQVAGANVSHLRTRDGDHEVDLIVEGDDGAIVAVEVKLSGAVDDADVRHLRWLRDRIGDRLVDAAVINTGQAAYRRKDGIAVVPAGSLGA